jgi:predicted NACHT family NTPase
MQHDPDYKSQYAPMHGERWTLLGGLDEAERSTRRLSGREYVTNAVAVVWLRVLDCCFLVCCD